MFKVCKMTLTGKHLANWTHRALVSFNTDKRIVVWLHSQQAKNNNVQYQLIGEPLKSVSHPSDLGVIVVETLKPHRQCAKAAKSANSIMRTIKASFMNITPKLFDKLYRPHLE